jgi:hypothetical protein
MLETISNSDFTASSLMQEVESFWWTKDIHLRESIEEVSAVSAVCVASSNRFSGFFVGNRTGNRKR